MREISEQAEQLLIENLKKLPYAEKRAKSYDASLKEILEYFFIKDNIANLRLWGKLPENRIIPYPVSQDKPVDFTEIEKELGFEIHPELKEWYSKCYFSDVDGIDGREPEKQAYIEARFDGVLPSMDISSAILGGFDKSELGFEDDFICNGHFCNIGWCSWGFSCTLEFNNDTGEVYVWDYEESAHYKISDSIRELILALESYWSDKPEEELFPLEGLI